MKHFTVEIHRKDSIITSNIEAESIMEALEHYKEYENVIKLVISERRSYEKSKF